MFRLYSKSTMADVGFGCVFKFSEHGRGENTMVRSWSIEVRRSTAEKYFHYLFGD